LISFCSEIPDVTSFFPSSDQEKYLIPRYPSNQIGVALMSHPKDY
jgi:hypothetical protein